MDRPRVYSPHIIQQRPAYGRKREDPIVNLSKDGKKKTYNVARLVALAFHGVPPDGMTVNHINCNWHDNRPENLEWVTMQANIDHARDHGIYPANIRSVTLESMDGIRYYFPNTVKACQFLNRNQHYLQKLKCQRKTTATNSDGQSFYIMNIGGDTHHSD